MTPAAPLGAAPADDPISYPGAPPDGDVLLDGDQLHPLFLTGHGLSAGPGAWALRYGHDDAGPGGDLGVLALLDDYLAERGGAPIAGRTPVLAVGSNRSPAQLARKLHEPARPALGLVPITRARVRGLGTGHSAHIGRWGYIPTTPAGRPGWHDQWITWLDETQLEIVNATEINYRLSCGPFPILLTADDSFELPARWVFYRSRWGALCLRPDAHGPSQPMTQIEAWRRLLGYPWFRDLAGVGRDTPASDVITLMRDRDDLRDATRDALASHGCAVPDRLADDAVTLAD